MAGCTEVSIFCCLCTDMGRVKFLSFADNFDPVSNKAKHCSLLKRLCLSKPQETIPETTVMTGHTSIAKVITT